MGQHGPGKATPTTVQRGSEGDSVDASEVDVGPEPEVRKPELE